MPPFHRGLNQVGSKEDVATGRIVPFYRFRWADFVLPSTLQLSPLLELLVEPVGCEMTSQKVELGLHEALVNAVRHGNSENPRNNCACEGFSRPIG